MAKYDLYPVKNSPDTLLLDVQAELLESMATTIVVPLILKKNTPNLIKRLNPVFRIEEKDYAMMPQIITSVPSSILKTPITNLSDNFSEITNALDMAFQGF